MDDDKVIIDTNIWAAHEMDYPDAVYLIEEILENEVEILMPSIVEMELMSHFEIETVQAIREGREGYISLADEIIDINSEIARLAGEIRRKAKLRRGKSPKGPDALVAAVSLYHDATLISNNDKDFKWIIENYGLKYYNPIKDNENYNAFNDYYRKSRGL